MLEPLDGRLFGPGQPCFGCAPDHPIGLRLAFERIDSGVKTHFTPPDRFQGPPGVMHGGLVLTAADEVGAWTVLAETEKFGFTVGLEAKIQRAVRIGDEVAAEGRVTKSTRRVVTVEVVMNQGEHPVFEGILKFALLDEAGAERVLGQPLPEAWRRFAR